jgi:hypothetical protein
MIIGFSLLLKDRKDYRVYFFGLILLLLAMIKNEFVTNK